MRHQDVNSKIIIVNIELLMIFCQFCTGPNIREFIATNRKSLGYNNAITLMKDNSNVHLILFIYTYDTKIDKCAGTKNGAHHGSTTVLVHFARVEFQIEVRGVAAPALSAPKTSDAATTYQHNNNNNNIIIAGIHGPIKSTSITFYNVNFLQQLKFMPGPFWGSVKLFVVFCQPSPLPVITRST